MTMSSAISARCCPRSGRRRSPIRERSGRMTAARRSGRRRRNAPARDRRRLDPHPRAAPPDRRTCSASSRPSPTRPCAAAARSRRRERRSTAGSPRWARRSTCCSRPAGPKPDLGALIGRAFVHGGRPRCGSKGRSWSVGADAAMALTLVFHELESNSIKYGALATEGGGSRSAGRWRRGAGGDWLSLNGRERDGPPCVAPTASGLRLADDREIARRPLRRRRRDRLSARRPRWRLSAPLARLAG